MTRFSVVFREEVWWGCGPSHLTDSILFSVWHGATFVVASLAVGESIVNTHHDTLAVDSVP
jgi:hypothetical protein